MKLNQKGLAHPVLVGLLVLVIGAVGFTAYRVGKSSNNAVTNSTDASDSSQVDELKIEKDEAETVKIPSEEKKTEPVVVKENKPVATTSPDKKYDKVYLSMTLVSAVQSGNVVNIHSKVEKAVSGTCNFKLYREGYDSIYASKKISNSQDCKGQINISGLQNYTGRSLYVWFDGDDGKTYANQNNSPITLTDPN